MASIIERLLAIDSCAVSDALDSLDLPPAVEGLSPLSVRKKIAGPVVTVKLGKNPPEGGSKQHLGTGAIEAASAGDVIAVEHIEREDCAGWGGVLSTGASLKGIAGIVIDGAARDIDEAIDLEFPVYGCKATAVTARGRIYEQDFNCPITVGGIEMSPGDYVLADSSGVAIIPKNRVEEVLQAAEMIAGKERLMVEELKKGTPITEVMGLNYEKMLGTQD